MATKKVKRERRRSTKNSAPKARASQVTSYWDRAFRAKDGYRAVLVKVRGRKGSVLEFFVVDPLTSTVEGDGKKPHRVDLEDGDVVWGELPSTAQLIANDDARRYGLLFLSSAWAKKNTRDGGGGGKWPYITAL